MFTIVFDLDGTLVDSAPDIHAAVNRMLAEEGAQPLPLATVTGFVGSGVPTLIERVMRACGETPTPERHRALVARFMAHYERAPATLSRLYPEVRPALAALAAKGYRSALCTNKPERTARGVLEAFGVSRDFVTVVGGDSLAVRKPDPAPLLSTLERAGASSGVFVGDSEIDAMTAEAAGVSFLLYTEGYRRGPASGIPCAARFADYATLPGLVERVRESEGRPDQPSHGP